MARGHHLCWTFIADAPVGAPIGLGIRVHSGTDKSYLAGFYQGGLRSTKHGRQVWIEPLLHFGLFSLSFPFFSIFFKHSHSTLSIITNQPFFVTSWQNDETMYNVQCTLCIHVPDWKSIINGVSA